MSRKKPTALEPSIRPDNCHAEQVWQQIREALRGLKYGQVTIIVQDGVVVQIDRIERKRLT